MHQAWSDLSYIEHEQERYVAIRSKTVSDLDAVRQQAVALENVMRITNTLFSRFLFVIPTGILYLENPVFFAAEPS